jgi:hypothetical protein
MTINNKFELYKTKIDRTRRKNEFTIFSVAEKYQ